MESNAGALGPDLFFLENRKSVDLRPDSPRKCVACGNCGRGCRSGSVYKFSTHLLPEIKTLDNFRLLEHARAIRFVALESANAEGFSISRVVAIDERTEQIIEIEAEVVIVCAGAIESPRLLLNSFADDPGKVAQVGEFLQDSPRAVVGSSLFADHIQQLAALGRRMLKKGSGYIVDDVGSPPGSGIHYAGTCRMAADPRGGVVDTDLKYFKSRNLYVCDGSVIPALGEKHPSLTIMALAHRLAKHLINTYQ